MAEDKVTSMRRMRQRIETVISEEEDNLKYMKSKLTSIKEVEVTYNKLLRSVKHLRDTYGIYKKQYDILKSLFFEEEKDESLQSKPHPKKDIYKFLEDKKLEIKIVKHWSTHDGKKSYVDILIDEQIHQKIPTYTLFNYRKDLKTMVQDFINNEDQKVRDQSPSRDENIQNNNFENPERHCSISPNSSNLNNNFEDISNAIVTMDYSNKLQICDFYKTLFSNYNDKMNEYTQIHKSIVIHLNNSIIAALTHNDTKMEFKEKNREYFYSDILMMGVQKSFQSRGLGKNLIMQLNKEIIVTWADKQAVGFYKKLKFEEDFDLGEVMKKHVDAWDNAVFMTKGVPKCWRFYVIKLIKNPDEISKLEIQDKKNSKSNKFIVNDSLYLISSTDLENQELSKSLNEALNCQGFSFEDDLEYLEEGLRINMGNVQELSEKNIKLFHQMKEKTRKMIYGPFKIEKSLEVGYYVKATNYIPKNSLICEYSGQVITYDEYSENDSIFWLDDKHVIEPIKSANLGKYLSGVNQKNISQANVQSMMCVIDNQLHILLYTLRKINKGEVLCYNYNAGKLKEYKTNNFKNLNKKKKCRNKKQINENNNESLDNIEYFEEEEAFLEIDHNEKINIFNEDKLSNIFKGKEKILAETKSSINDFYKDKVPNARSIRPLKLIEMGKEYKVISKTEKTDKKGYMKRILTIKIEGITFKVDSDKFYSIKSKNEESRQNK